MVSAPTHKPGMPPLCKGRWIFAAGEKTEGLFLYLVPVLVPSLPYTGTKKNRKKIAKKHLTILACCGNIGDTSKGVYFFVPIFRRAPIGHKT